MKKMIVILALILISINLICAGVDYTSINPDTLPEYVGSLQDPQIKIVYYDPYGIYIFIEFNGSLYVAKL